MYHLFSLVGKRVVHGNRCTYFCISVVKFIFELSSQLSHTVKFLSLMLLAEV